MTKVLLTGGAGYIGSATASVLQQAGFEPIVLDNLSKGHRWAASFGPFVQGDVGDPACVQSVCETYRPNALLHFAAFIEVGESVAEPAKYWDNNFEKAKRLFDTVTACGVKAAVFSSTAAVYGTPTTDAPIDENHAKAPINPYGESKLAAETYLREIEAKGIKSFTLRYFNAAGAPPLATGIGEAHTPETHLVPNALLAGLGYKDQIKMFGSDYPTRDGTALRDYIHVLDLADAHVRAVKHLLGGGATEICNLGTGTGSTVAEVVAAVEKALGAPIPKTREARRAGDPAALVADSSRAQAVLGWRPQHTLDDIVTSALAWHKTERYKQEMGF